MKTRFFFFALFAAGTAAAQQPVNTQHGIVAIHNLRIEDTTYIGQVPGIWAIDGADTMFGFLPMYMLPDTTLLVGGDTVYTSGNFAGGGGLDSVNLAADVYGVLPVPNGGTGHDTLTANKVLVGNGTSPMLSPAALHWDNVNSRLGIGTSSPAAALHVHGNITSPGSGALSEKFGALSEATVQGLAVGYLAKANAASGYATAIGTYTTASNTFSTALGNGATASGHSAFALGYNAVASNTYSIAIGANTNNSLNNTIMFGGTSGAWINTMVIGMGNTSATASINGSAEIRTTNASGTDNSGSNLTLTAGRSTGMANSGFIDFQTGGAGITGSTLNSAASRLRIISGGNVGIGTTTPARRLHIAGEVRITDLVTDTATVIVGADADGDLDRIVVGSGLSLANDTLKATGGGGGLDSVNLAADVYGVLPVINGGTGHDTLTANKVLVGNGTSAILSPANLHWDNGNSRLGIGTASPTDALDVNGTARVRSFTGTPTRLVGADGTGLLDTVIIGTGLTLSGGTLSASGGSSGTVTSVGLSAFTGLTVTGSPVTTSGTLALANGLAANKVMVSNGTTGYLAPTELHWDDILKRLGLGVASPNQQLELSNSMRLPVTTGSTIGVVYKGGDRFIHDYTPAGISAVERNLFIGNAAGNFTGSGANSSNVGISGSALSALTTGRQNIAIGTSTLQALTEGSGNVAIGFNALASLTTASNNTNNIAIGTSAGNSVFGGAGNHTCTSSIFIGANTLASASSTTNQIVIGHNATGAGSNTVTLGHTSIVRTILRSNVDIGGNLFSSAANWGTNGVGVSVTASTYTNTTAGNQATLVANSFAQPTFAANAAQTTTSAATMYIANSPAAGTNMTITNPYSLWVDAGNSRFGGNVGFGEASPAYPIDVNATTAIRLPRGTDAQRPAAAAALFRYSTTTNGVEWNDGSNWQKAIAGEGQGPASGFNRVALWTGASTQTSDEDFSFNISTGQLKMLKYSSATAFAGTSVAQLHVTSTGEVITKTPRDTQYVHLVAVNPGTAVTQTAGTAFHQASWLVPEWMDGYSITRADYALTNCNSTSGTLPVGLRQSNTTNGTVASNLMAVSFAGATTEVRKSSTSTLTVNKNQWLRVEVNPTTSGTLNNTVEGLLVVLMLTK